MEKTNRQRVLSLLAAPAVILGSVSLAACAGADAGNKPSGAASGGTLIYLEPQTFSALYTPDGGFYPNGGVINNITDRLLYQNPETLELEPWIATELPEVNEDATEYTFKLREGVTYSDGTALDAQNVVNNFDLYGHGDPDRKLILSEAINNYDYGEVIDENTVTFHFTAPSPGFAQAVSTINSGLYSNATLELDGNGFGPGNAVNIIGSGPFVISSETVGTELNLVAREDYDWAPESSDHQGRAYLDGITYIVTPEDSVRVGSLTSGQAHIARQIGAQDETQITGAGLDLVVAPTNGVTNGINLRFRHPLLKDIRVRQAIFAGINRQDIIETLFTESYPLATSPIASTALGYEDQSELIPEYDPEAADALLTEAGWVVGADGIREKDGQKLSITFNEALPQPRSREVVTKIQEQLASLGIEVKLNPGDQAAQTLAAQDINTIQVFHSMVGRADHDVIKSQYHSENRNVLLNRDVEDQSIGDPELEALLEEVASTPDSEGRAAASAKVQRHLVEQAYALPLFEEPQTFGVQKNVSGFKTESIGRPSFYDVQLSQ